MSRGGPLVVVGDSLLDVDLEGRAGRLAPDAPVPVLDDPVAHPRPGGAALAAALVARERGAGEVVLVTALADDDDAARLRALLSAAGVRVVAVPREGTTPVKKRVRADGQTLLRLDTGRSGPLGAVPDEAREVLAAASAVLVSDYGRGTAGEATLRADLTALARRVPVVWDPHPRGGAPVPGVRLATPNRAEAAHFADALRPDASSRPLGPLATTTRHADRLLHAWSAQGVVVTLGERGALLTQGTSSPSVFPAPPTRALDPCGAGDRFAGAVTSALAAGALTPEAVQHAVVEAARFVAAGGAGAVRPGTTTTRATDAAALDVVARVRAEGGTVVATGGCFDLLHAGHVATLEAARSLGDCLVVCVNADASVRRLKGAGRPLVPEADRARVLAALAPVDQVVVFAEDTPNAVLRRIRPDVWVKGGDYAGAELPEAALLREWGGQSVVLPYLEGRSTTGLVASAVAGHLGG